MRRFTDVSQTPKVTPVEERPEVVPVFYKNGHKYTKGYGLKADTLGPGIKSWWARIKSACMYFGGPTGRIYTLVVLMTWWCSLLADPSQPRDEQAWADCLQTLDDIDHTILSVIHNTPTSSPPNESSSGASTVQPTQPRGSKRASPSEELSRKRLRAGQA